MRESASAGLRRTPLHALHLELGARMVAFAGYEMPLSYPGGILAEHRQCRGKAALFDVSHMGQAWLADDSDVAGALETQVCGDIAGLTPGAMRYTMLLADDGGTVDDLIVTRPDASERLALVVNASRKETDYRRLAERLAGRARIEAADGLALLALQGPRAAMALAALCPAAVELRFMRSAQLALDGIACTVGRSGYTGEDGFEISMRRTARRTWRADCSPTPKWAPPGSARAMSCASKQGCACGARISTRRHRRSRRGWNGRFPGVGGRRRISPARSVSCASSRKVRHAAASVCAPQAGFRRAPGRRSSTAAGARWEK